MTDKIYDTDPEVYGRSTKVKAIRTRSEIEGVLAKFGVTDWGWKWETHPDKSIRKVQLIFTLPPERFHDQELSNLTVIVDAPYIYHKHGRGKKDSLNWDVSLRNLYWYVLTHLSQAYVRQSGLIKEMLPHIVNREGKTLTDSFKQEIAALPEMMNVT